MFEIVPEWRASRPADFLRCDPWWEEKLFEKKRIVLMKERKLKKTVYIQLSQSKCQEVVWKAKMVGGRRKTLSNLDSKQWTWRQRFGLTNANDFEEYLLENAKEPPWVGLRVNKMRFKGSKVSKVDDESELTWKNFCIKFKRKKNQLWDLGKMSKKWFWARFC